MPSRSIETEQDRKQLLRWLSDFPLPFAVDVARGKRRTLRQNRLQRQWMNEISEQLGDMSAEEVRAYCKLTIGVPILRAEHDGFCEKYDRLIKPLPYQTKLEYMMEPLDFPVTRLFTTKQHAAYLDGIQRHFGERGIILTDPDEGRFDRVSSENAGASA